jgi:hypothetical protein
MRIARRIFLTFGFFKISAGAGISGNGINHKF